MRHRGTGSKETLPSGKTRVRVWRDGKRVSKIVPTEEEADSLLNGWHTAAALGEVSACAPTLAEWGKRWLLTRTCRSLKSEQLRWQSLVETSPLGARHLDEIRRVHVLDYARWLAKRQARKPKGGGHKASGKPISPQTQRHALALVKRALQGAVDAELIASNPAEGVRADRAPQQDEAWTFLEPDEIEAVCQAPGGDLFCVAIYTGLRAGEMWGLRWEDVIADGHRPRLEVRRSKNGKARTVPLLEPARRALLRLRPPDARGLVFPGSAGDQHAEGYDAGWADVKDAAGTRPGHKSRAGITRRVRFHDLRHTCASHLVQGTWGRSWSLEEVRDFLGHSSITVTQRYAHLGDRLHRAAAETVSPRSAHGVRDGMQGVSSVGPVGFEPTTNGLKGPRYPQVQQGDREDRGLSVGSLAADFLTAAAGGTIRDSLALQLASATIEAAMQDRAVVLAWRVLAGGDHAGVAAIELAGLLLAREARVKAG